MKRYCSGLVSSSEGFIEQKMLERIDGAYVLYKDAMAEIEKLRAENARLTYALRWEENRAELIRTHGDDCWRWGPSHYECAIREIERLNNALGSATCEIRFLKAKACGIISND